MIVDTKDHITYRSYSDGEKAVDLQLCVGTFDSDDAARKGCAAVHHLENEMACHHLDQRYIFKIGSKLVVTSVFSPDHKQTTLYIRISCRGWDNDVDIIVNALKSFVGLCAQQHSAVQTSLVFVPRVATVIPTRMARRKTLRELVRERRNDPVLLTTRVDDCDTL